MLIGNTEIGREQMPSYVKPEQQPYHLYQMMQDTLKQNLPQQMQVQQAMPNGTNAENNQSMWNGGNQ